MLNWYDNTNVLLWRLGAGDTNATYIATTDFPLVNIIDPTPWPSPGATCLLWLTASQCRSDANQSRDYLYHFTSNKTTSIPHTECL